MFLALGAQLWSLLYRSTISMAAVEEECQDCEDDYAQRDANSNSR
jgi:hypothetical protein